MVAATRNKRGRPDIFEAYMVEPDKARNLHRSVFNDKDGRTLTNEFYACYGYNHIIRDIRDEELKQIFWTEKGKWKAKGIAEQIGRMYLQNNYDLESCQRMTIKAVEFLEQGYTVKQIERWLRHGRNFNDW